MNRQDLEATKTQILAPPSFLFANTEIVAESFFFFFFFFSDFASSIDSDLQTPGPQVAVVLD
jgi:hypothetical protein